MQKLIVLLIVISIAQGTYAQKTCWCKFEVSSQNQQYVASIETTDKNISHSNWRSNWQIKVYRKENDNRKLIWESKYLYSGKPMGILSDNGQYFTYVESWYYKDLPLFTIYKNGLKVPSEIDGSSLSIPKKELKKTSLHYLWLSQSDVPYQYKTSGNGTVYLAVKTINQKTLNINLDYGTFIDNKQQMTSVR